MTATFIIVRGIHLQRRIELQQFVKQTVVERVKRDPDFAKAMMDEAITLFLKGEPEPARIILRDLVKDRKSTRLNSSH